MLLLKLLSHVLIDMAEIKEITAMCREGRLNEAYTMAKDGVEMAPNDPWQQRALGWALYYMLKADAESGNYKMLLEHLDELVSLSLLTVENDSMIFDNVQLQIAAFVKNSLFLSRRFIVALVTSLTSTRQNSWVWHSLKN